MDHDSPQPADAAVPDAARPRSLLATLLLVGIVGLLIFTWASVAGALDMNPGSDRDRATEELAADARAMDRGAALLEDAGSVAELREAGRAIGELRLSLDDQRRRLAGVEDPELADVALRTHRQVVAVLDGWAQLERLDRADVRSWPRRESGPVLESTNRLRDGLVSKVRALADGDDPVEIDHARARAATLKVARYLDRAGRRG